MYEKTIGLAAVILMSSWGMAYAASHTGVEDNSALVESTVPTVVLESTESPAQTPAAKDVFALPEVVVTSTKFSENFIDAPGTVEVIGRHDIDARNVKDIDEAVNGITGVYDRKTKGFADIMPSVNVRGFYGTNRNLILIDGQPVGDDVWRRFPMEMVDHIEVVKGPFSALYGSGAMGGVVNVITKKPAKSLEAKVVGDYGTYNTWSSGAILTGRSGGFFFAGAARKRATDGYASSLTVKKATASAAKPTTGTQVNGWNSTTDSQGNAAYLVGDAGLNWYRDESYYGKLGYDFSKKTSLSVDYTHTFYRYGYDTGNSYLTDVSGKSVTTGSVYYYDPSTAKWESFSVTPYLFMGTYGGNTINRVAASGESRIEDLSIKGGFTWDKNDYWWVQPSATSPYVQPSWTRNIRGEVALSHPLPLGQALMLGAEVGGITSHNETDSLNGWGSQDNRTGVTTALQRGKTLLTGVYLQDKIKLLKSLDVYLGARWDDWSVSDGYNYSVKTGPTTLAQTFGTSEESRVSPRASAVYAIDGETRLKGSIGGAFRGPSPSDMFSSWQSVSSGVTTTSLANDGLKPEKVFSGEVGVEKYVSKKTSLQVTYFHNHMTDYIYTKSFTAAEVAAFNSAKGTNFSTITQKQNIASASCDGLELGMRNRVAGWLEAFGNCTAMQSKVASNPSNSSSVGKQLPSIPGVTFNVGMDAFWKGLGANVTGRYVGKAYSKDDNSDIYNNVFGSYDPFFVVDAKVSYGVSVGRFQPKVSVACNNIGNLQYYQYYKSPGRTWTLSAEAAF